jgi:hypothetical protein
LSRVVLQYRYAHGAHTCFLPCTAHIPWNVISSQMSHTRRSPSPRMLPHTIPARLLLQGGRGRLCFGDLADDKAQLPMDCMQRVVRRAAASTPAPRSSVLERCRCAVASLIDRASRGRLGGLAPDEQLAPALHARQHAARAPIARRSELLLAPNARSAVPAAAERVGTSTAGVRCAPTVRAPSETAAAASRGAPPTAMQGDFFFQNR